MRCGFVALACASRGENFFTVLAQDYRRCSPGWHTLRTCPFGRDVGGFTPFVDESRPFVVPKASAALSVSAESARRMAVGWAAKFRLRCVNTPSCCGQPSAPDSRGFFTSIGFLWPGSA